MEQNVEASGERKKAIMQVDGLRANGIFADLLFHDRRNKLNKILVRLPIYPIYGFKFQQELVRKVVDYDAVYIRKYIIDWSLIRILKVLRKNHSLKLILEFPTYPYDKELTSVEDWILLLKERMYRKQLFRYIDRIVNFSKNSSLFNIKCINTSNGIDVSKVPLRNVDDRDDNTIQLLGVATLEKWHGYDRVIDGLYRYYKCTGHDKEVFFNIVGEGHELPILQKKVKEKKLQKYVKFHGLLHGEALDEMFDICDVGIGSLGMHRIDMIEGYTLKVREYMARGIPFVFGYNDNLIEKSSIYFYRKVVPDDSPVDILEFIKFKSDIERYGKKTLAREMRTYAENNLSWEKQMKPVADYIMNEG